MKKTDPYMPTSLIKLLQSQCIENLNENNSYHGEKAHERNSNHNIYESLDQVNSNLTAVKGGVISGQRLMNDKNLFSLMGINMKKWGCSLENYL